MDLELSVVIVFYIPVKIFSSIFRSHIIILNTILGYFNQCVIDLGMQNLFLDQQWCPNFFNGGTKICPQISNGIPTLSMVKLKNFPQISNGIPTLSLVELNFVLSSTMVSQLCQWWSLNFSPD